MWSCLTTTVCVVNSKRISTIRDCDVFLRLAALAQSFSLALNAADTANLSISDINAFFDVDLIILID